MHFAGKKIVHGYLRDFLQKEITRKRCLGAKRLYFAGKTFLQNKLLEFFLQKCFYAENFEVQNLCILQVKNFLQEDAVTLKSFCKKSRKIF